MYLSCFKKIESKNHVLLQTYIKIMHYIKTLSIFTLLSFTNYLFAQSETKIELVKANKLSPGKAIGITGERLLGDVVFKHENTLMYCDSAYLYEVENMLDAFGHVYINDNDSIYINADSLHYDGNTKICELHYKVKLQDQKMTLSTQHLSYNLIDKIAYYYNGGVIKDKKNVLKSEFGFYYSRSKTFSFRKNVVLTNPEYVMKSDTLMYNTINKTAYFYGPTTITSKKNLIYCENGWYNTDNDISQFNEKAFLKNENQVLSGDSLYYNRKQDYGKAFNKVTLIDTVEHYIVKGNYCEHFGVRNESRFTDSVLAMVIDENKDTLFLHADTLKVQANSDKKIDFIYAYYKCKFYRSDLQGMSDSLVYNFKDSIIELYHFPLIWSDSTQLSGDLIKLKTNNGKPQTLFVDGESFIFSLDTLSFYNQVAGRTMVGHFINNDLKKVDVFGNSETIYFVREEDKLLVGINFCVAGDLQLWVENKGIERIKYYDKPDGKLVPESTVSEKEMKLRGFKNKQIQRPLGPLDVFRWELDEGSIENN